MFIYNVVLLFWRIYISHIVFCNLTPERSQRVSHRVSHIPKVRRYPVSVTTLCCSDTFTSVTGGHLKTGLIIV